MTPVAGARRRTPEELTASSARLVRTGGTSRAGQLIIDTHLKAARAHLGALDRHPMRFSQHNWDALLHRLQAASQYSTTPITGISDILIDLLSSNPNLTDDHTLELIVFASQHPATYPHLVDRLDGTGLVLLYGYTLISTQWHDALTALLNERGSLLPALGSIDTTYDVAELLHYYEQATDGAPRVRAVLATLLPTWTASPSEAVAAARGIVS